MASFVLKIRASSDEDIFISRGSPEVITTYMFFFLFPDQQGEVFFTVPIMFSSGTSNESNNTTLYWAQILMLCIDTSWINEGSHYSVS